MTHEVVELTKAMIRIQSVSNQSNAPISDLIQTWLDEHGFVTERLSYIDPDGLEKVNIVGQKGSGTGGLAFFGHSDTVPGQEADWPAFDPEVRDGRLFGRGACDMKGQIAASMLAAAHVDESKLKSPVFVVVAADEETGGYGVRQVADESKLMAAAGTRYGVIIEPTESKPVYAHKGVGAMFVTARGVAAHTSTGKGVSANFKIAPFLAEMAAYADELLTNPIYHNDEFDPPSNGFNMRLNDGGGPINVTADKCVCRLGFRYMPNSRAEEIIAHIEARAAHYGLETESETLQPLYTDRESPLVKAASAATGGKAPETVPYGTDGLKLNHKFELVVLGAGDIGLAHTTRESIPVDELVESVGIYERLIEMVCISAEI